jgi:hypothetical protein
MVAGRPMDARVRQRGARGLEPLADRRAARREEPHYTINLMVPLFNPGPIEHPDIPIHVAAVNSVMCRMAGEVADGIRIHPVCTPSYIETVMLPAVRAGAARSGRPLDRFQVCMKPLVAAAATEEELMPKVRDVRARISFYASTPQYRAAFAHHGLGDLADELKLLSRAQRWEEMPAKINDEVLQTYVTVGTYDQIAQKLLERYGRVITHCEFSIAVKDGADKERLRAIAQTIQAPSVSPPVQPVASDDKLPAAADVVVIGAGIAGCTAAYELAKKGHKVALIEKGRVGGEQSSRNWGWVRQQHRDLRELPLAMKSLQIWSGLNEEIGAESGFRRTGLIYVTTRPADFAQWEGVDAEGARVPDAQQDSVPHRGQGADAGQRAGVDRRRAFAEPTAAASRRSPAPQSPRRRADAVPRSTRIAPRAVSRRRPGKVSGVITEKGTIRTQAVLLAAARGAGCSAAATTCACRRRA